MAYQVERDYIFNSLKSRSVDIPDSIYHYTSPQGMDGILFNDKKHPLLWFSRFDCLNDRNEGAGILNVYKSVLRSMLDKQELTEEFYAHVVDLEPSDIETFSYAKENSLDGPSTLLFNDRYDVIFVVFHLKMIAFPCGIIT